jgi:exodeoxyribonuclease VII large subunit
MTSIKDQRILSVSQLTRAIKNNLENEYRFVRISGEISNLKTPYSGHSYFTLKDSSAQIRAVLFKQQKRFVSLDMKDGQEVVCFGRVTVYEPRGDYQLILDSVELFGQGKLQLEFEALKAKLESKGYFDQSIKKQIPSFPKKIIVISSATGAALQDFLKIVKLRSSPMHILIIPALMQ